MHSDIQMIEDLDVEIKRLQKEMSDLRRKVINLETECIELQLNKKSLEESLRLNRLKKGLLSDGTSE